MTMSQYRKTVILRRRLAIYHEPFRPPAYFGGQVFAVELGHRSKKIRLTAPLRALSATVRLKSSATTFSGTDFHAPENMCHNGPLLTCPIS
jgi:hypothetical protein